jgi:hypothetical protein
MIAKSNKKKLPPAVTLTLLLLTFSIPMIAAWYFYHHRITVSHAQTNHGFLITPPLPISKLTLLNGKNQKINNELNPKNFQAPPSSTRTNGKWMLVYFTPSTCDSNCKKRLYFFRQIQKASGKNSSRVERAILTSTTKNIPLANLLSKSFPETRYLKVNVKEYTRIIQKNIKAPFASQAGATFIVDPFGNIIMAYEPMQDANDIFKDLGHLLSVSQIG